MSLYKKITIISAFCLLCGTTTWGQEEAPNTIRFNDDTVVEISGFGDFVTTIQEHNDEDAIGLGQAEIGLASALNEQLSIEMAMAYDTDAFGIGCFIIDYNVYSAPEDNTVRSLSIGGGQFDVPFGIGFEHYASTDRQFVSSPLVTTLSHDEWNDIGGYAQLDASWGTLTAFVTNGFTFDESVHENSDIDVESKIAVGGRLGLSPFSQLTIGASYADFIDQTGLKSMDMIGADLVFNLYRFSVQGEYIMHRFSDPTYDSQEHEGYYIQASYQLNRWSLNSRYDRFDSSPEIFGDLRRVTSGITYSLDNNVELRGEYQIIEEADNAALMQIVVQF